MYGKNKDLVADATSGWGAEMEKTVNIRKTSNNVLCRYSHFSHTSAIETDNNI